MNIIIGVYTNTFNNFPKEIFNNKSAGPVLVIETSNGEHYIKVYEISHKDDLNLDEYRRFIDALINSIDSSESIYSIVSLIKKNYFTTYLVIHSKTFERLIENIYSLSKIADIFKPQINISDKTNFKLKDYIIIPLIAARIRKNNILKIHYILTKSQTNYPKRELRYNEHLLMNKKSIQDNEYIILGRSLNIYPEIDVLLPIEYLYRHTLIIGGSGSGKTTTAKKIITSLARKKYNGYIVVFDWHREYTAISSKYNTKIYKPGKPGKTNISIPPINCNTDLETTLQIIESSLQLTPPQAYMLAKITEKICENKNTATFLDLLKIIENEKERTSIRSELEVMQALYRRIYTLARGQGLFLFSNEDKINKILINTNNKPSIIIIDLSTIINVKLRVIYTSIMLKTIFEYKSLYLIKDPILMVIEETHNLLQYNNTILDQMVAESRKYDLGFIIIEQSITNLTNNIIANTFNKIIHNIASPADLEKLKQMVPLNYIKVLPRLDVGEAVFTGGIFKEPLIIKIT